MLFNKCEWSNRIWIETATKISANKLSEQFDHKCTYKCSYNIDWVQFVCSLEQENPQVHCACLVFMVLLQWILHACLVFIALMLRVLVSIFISKTHNHFWSAVRIAHDTHQCVLINVFILMRPQSDSQSMHFEWRYLKWWCRKRFHPEGHYLAQ